MRPVDLRLLVEETRAMLVHVIPKKIAIEICGARDRCPVLADAVQIGQVLMNLAVNARDAMPEGGTLSFETGTVEVADNDPGHPGVAPRSYSLLKVRDTGAGMSPEVRAKIFDPFFTTKNAGSGHRARARDGLRHRVAARGRRAGGERAGSGRDVFHLPPRRPGGARRRSPARAERRRNDPARRGRRPGAACHGAQARRPRVPGAHGRRRRGSPEPSREGRSPARPPALRCRAPRRRRPTDRRGRARAGRRRAGRLHLRTPRVAARADGACSSPGTCSCRRASAPRRSPGACGTCSTAPC